MFACGGSIVGGALTGSGKPTGAVCCSVCERWKLQSKAVEVHGVPRDVSEVVWSTRTTHGELEYEALVVHLPRSQSSAHHCTQHRTCRPPNFNACEGSCRRPRPRGPTIN